MHGQLCILSTSQAHMQVGGVRLYVLDAVLWGLHIGIVATQNLKALSADTNLNLDDLRGPAIRGVMDGSVTTQCLGNCWLQYLVQIRDS